MERLFEWARVCVEIVGILAIIAGIGWLVAWAAFGHFSGADCNDSDQIVLVSPGGKHTVKAFHRVCTAGGENPSTADFVYLSTGNSNKGYEYTPIAQFGDTAPGQTHVRWDGPDQITISYPASARVEEAYAKVLGVRVVMNPPLPRIFSAESK